MKKIVDNHLNELVYEKIKLMILEGNLVPDTKIDKSTLAETLGVSITPLNEAFNRLAGEKLMYQKKGKGYYVRKITPVDLKDFYEVRAGLEGIVIRRCISELADGSIEELVHMFDRFILPLDRISLKKYIKTDQDFHKKIIQLSGNKIIIDFDNGFDFLIKSYQRGVIRPPELTLPEHIRIIEAIKKRDAKKAQELIISHHLTTRDFIENNHLKYG